MGRKDKGLVWEFIEEKDDKNGFEWWTGEGEEKGKLGIN